MCIEHYMAHIVIWDEVWPVWGFLIHILSYEIHGNDIN